MSKQLSFALPVGNSLAAGDFFVSDANAQAYAMITGAGQWPDRKLLLTGPHGAGKSHLARIWAQAQTAPILSAPALTPDLPPLRDAPAVVIEDMQHLPRAAEEWVFHLHNHLAATGGHLLMTADRAPLLWPVALPDLASRMQATTNVRIDDPDDRLLTALLTKLFADRQLAPPPAAIAWLATRIERSHAAAAAAVARLDAAALAEGRELTAAFMRQAMDNAGEAGR